MYSESVAFFDVDGVLLDSLPQHLAICRDYAKKLHLDLRMPSTEEFRNWVSQGTTVSPMRNFFLAVGFPEEAVTEAVADYEREFMEKYPPPVFRGAEEMLQRVAQDGWQLGLVTSNTRENVEPALRSVMPLFPPELRLYHEPTNPLRSKSERLLLGAETAHASPSHCVFVGDQPADQSAAQEADMRFLGVTYGWGIIRGCPGSETVDSVTQIPDKLASMRMR